jgi:hypothetical protein
MFTQQIIENGICVLFLVLTRQWTFRLSGSSVLFWKAWIRIMAWRPIGMTEVFRVFLSPFKQMLW